MASVSPFAKLVACVDSLAHTSVGRPKMLMARSPGECRWPTTADGASTADSRQLSAGRSRNLSWLKLPSKPGGTELSVHDRATQPDDRGLEAAFVPDAELQAGGGDRVDGALGVVARSAERLLAGHVLAVRRRGDDLFGVELVRRAQDHGVDGVVAQHGVELGVTSASLASSRHGHRGRRRHRRRSARTRCRQVPTTLRPHHPSPTTAALITEPVKAGVAATHRRGRELRAVVSHSVVVAAGCRRSIDDQWTTGDLS